MPNDFSIGLSFAWYFQFGHLMFALTFNNNIVGEIEDEVLQVAHFKIFNGRHIITKDKLFVITTRWEFRMLHLYKFIQLLFFNEAPLAPLV